MSLAHGGATRAPCDKPVFFAQIEVEVLTDRLNVERPMEVLGALLREKHAESTPLEAHNLFLLSPRSALIL